MREIEFRGRLIKDQYGKKKGEWVYGYFYEECGLTYIIESTQKQHGSICYKNIPYIVDKETVGQFTGIKDCNGVKIFKGDIVKGTCHKTDRCLSKLVPFDVIGVVEYDEKYQAPVVRMGGSRLHIEVAIKGEVIGNIHDNPRTDLM